VLSCVTCSVCQTLMLAAAGSSLDCRPLRLPFIHGPAFARETMRVPASASVEKPGTEAYGYDATCQAAWAALHSKNTYLSAQFRRLAARKGKKRAKRT
jgi:hypothetical protein